MIKKWLRVLCNQLLVLLPEIPEHYIYIYVQNMPLLPIAPLLTNDNIGIHSMCTPCKNAVQHTKNTIQIDDIIFKNLIHQGIIY